MSCGIDEAETTSGVCTSCPAGKIPDPSDKTRCKFCGKDKAETISGVCTSCPPGEIPDSLDKTKCKSCDTDEAESTRGNCTRCPEGSRGQDPDDKTRCLGTNFTI